MLRNIVQEIVLFQIFSSQVYSYPINIILSAITVFFFKYILLIFEAHNNCTLSTIKYTYFLLGYILHKSFTHKYDDSIVKAPFLK